MNCAIKKFKNFKTAVDAVGEIGVFDIGNSFESIPDQNTSWHKQISEYVNSFDYDKNLSKKTANKIYYESFMTDFQNWFTNNGKNPVHRYSNADGTPILENGYVRNWIGQRFHIMPKELTQDAYLSNRAARLYPSNNIVSDNVVLSIDEFLSAVNSNYSNTFQGKILNEIKPYMRIKNVVISDTGFTGERENAIGYYDPNTKEIVIRNGLSDDEVLLVATHEATHDIIKVGLANNEKYENDVLAIMNKVKSLSSKYRQYFYALDNGEEVLSTEEFISGVMSDGLFRNNLQNFNKQNFFSKILTGIKNLFGLSNNYVSTTLKIADKVMKLQQDILADRKQKAAEGYVETTSVRERGVSSLLRENLLIHRDRAGSGKNFDDRINESRVNKYMAILRSNEYIIKVAGKTLDFTAYMNDTEQLAKQVREQLMPLDKELQNKKIDSIIKFFSNDPLTGGRGNMENYNDFFIAKDEKGDNYPIVEQNVVEKLRSIFQYKSGTIVMQYKEVAKFLESIKSPYAKSFDENLLDSDVDPVVVIHSTKENLDLSIYDFTYRFDLNIDGIGLKNNNLFRNYIEDVASKGEVSAKSLGIDLKANYGDYKQLRLFILASKVVKENGAGNVQFRDIASLNLVSSKGKQGLRYNSVDIVRMTRNMERIKKIKTFMESLPSNVSDIFNSDIVTEFKNYQADYTVILRNILYSARESKRKAGKITPQLDRQISVIDQFIENQDEWRPLLDIVEERLRFYKQNPTSLSNNKAEYDYLSHIYENLKAFKSNKGFIGSNSRTNILNYFNTMSAQPNVVVRETVQIFKDANAEVIGVYQKDEKMINEKVKEIMAFYKANPQLGININPGKERTLNTSGEWYKRLFVYKTFRANEEPTKLKEINTGMLHVDRSQPGSEKLDNKEIEFANWFADLFDKHVKNMYRFKEMGKNRNLVWNKEKTQRVLDMEKVEKEVAIQFAMNWKHGMSPLMYASAGELLAQGQKLESIRKFFLRNFDPIQLMNEAVKIVNIEETTFAVKSFFEGQITGAESNEYGGKQRMEMLSLAIDGDVPELFREEKRGKFYYTVDGLSTDLETISKFFVMDDYWTKAMNENVLPAFEAANTRLETFEKMGENQDKNKKMISRYWDLVINTQGQSEDKESKMWQGMTRASRIVYQMTMFNGLAYSPTVAVTSMMANITESVKLALANTIGNPYDLFLPGDLTSAMYQVSFDKEGSKKASVLGDVFQIINRSKIESLQHQRYKQGNKSLLTQHYANIMAWVTDYEARKVVMTAQLKHEGSWDAYSVDEKGEPVYDVKKDKRYYNPDGTQSKEQKFLMDELRKDLLDDQRFRDQQLEADMKNPDNKLPVWGHSSRQQQKFEWIGNKFIIGTYNPTDTHPYDVFNMVKLATMFKKFMISKIEHRLGKKLETKGGTEGAEGGTWIVVEQPDGTLKKIWYNVELEGTYRTFFNYMTKNIKNVTKGKGFEAMTEQEKHNTAQTVGDMIFFALTMAFIYGLAGLGGDDDDKKMALADHRLVRAWKNGMLTSIALAPDQIREMFSSIPVLDQINALYRIATIRGTERDYMRMIPGTSVYRTIDESIDIFEDTEEVVQ